jgi:putative glutamine amidotransferase
MSVRIALPVPSSDPEYNHRSLTPYLHALRAAGAVPIIIPIDSTQAEIARILTRTQGVLLPGSRFDVEPERYNQAREPACGPADPARTAMDELLLQDAFHLKKPVLGICQGCQSLNAWCGGTLIQDLKTVVNHRAGREVIEAHAIRIVPGSRLAALAPGGAGVGELVTSTHHQAIGVAGDRLRVVAVSPDDGVVEAVELESADHFVLAVQWHPERTYDVKPLSRDLFAGLVRAAEQWRQLPQQEGDSFGR